MIELLNDHTPLGPPWGRLVVVASLFVLAWLLTQGARLGGRLLAARTAARPGTDGQLATEVVLERRQRQTTIGILVTGVRYAAYGLAVVLSIVALAGARRGDAIVGVSFIAILLAFAFQRLLADVVAGMLMVFDGWVRVGDSVIVEPWGVEGLVEEISVRALTLRTVEGETVRVPNSEVKAVRVVPRGLRTLETELFVRDAEQGRELVAEIARIVPTGSTQFVQPPTVVECTPLDPSLARLRLRALVAPGREWLVAELLPSLVRERAAEGLVVHGPISVVADERARARFASAALPDDAGDRRAAGDRGPRPAPRSGLRRRDAPSGTTR
ncbi:MAG: mechanosensitive ion channel family protein [Thermoleophilia bacterium]